MFYGPFCPALMIRYVSHVALWLVASVAIRILVESWTRNEKTTSMYFEADRCRKMHALQLLS